MLNSTEYPYAIRLLGFSPEDMDEIATVLAEAPPPGPGYLCLFEGSLQEPDITIVNGADLPALARLAADEPSVLQPAIVVGAKTTVLDVAHLTVPIDPDDLFDLLAKLLEARAVALAATAAPSQVPDRRRKPRLDFDLTEPTEYLAKRKQPPAGAVLLIDSSKALREHIVKLLQPRRLSVEWTDSAATAVRLCEETPVALVLVNTATPGVDPYDVCADIKRLPGGLRICVVLLNAAGFDYDHERARAVGIRGYLDKPVADRNLLGVLVRLLSLGPVAQEAA